MNNINSVSKHESKAFSKYMSLMTLVTFAAFGLISLVILPLYDNLASNVLYQDSIWCYVLYYLYKILELSVFFIVFPVTIYAIYLYGARGCVKFFFIYPVGVIFRYVTNYIADIAIDGKLPNFDTFIEYDLPIVGGLVLVELVQYALVILGASLVFKYAKRVFAIKERAAKKLDMQVSLHDDIFPINKFYARKNPMYKASLITAAVFFAIRAFGHLLYQFTMLVYSGFSEGWLVLTFDLLTDACLALLLYLVTLLMIQKIDELQIYISEHPADDAPKGEGIDI